VLGGPLARFLSGHLLFGNIDPLLLHSPTRRLTSPRVEHGCSETLHSRGHPFPFTVPIDFWSLMLEELCASFFFASSFPFVVPSRFLPHPTPPCAQVLFPLQSNPIAALRFSEGPLTQFEVGFFIPFTFVVPSYTQIVPHQVVFLLPSPDYVSVIWGFLLIPGSSIPVNGTRCLCKIAQFLIVSLLFWAGPPPRFRRPSSLF